MCTKVIHAFSVHAKGVKLGCPKGFSSCFLFSLLFFSVFIFTPRITEGILSLPHLFLVLLSIFPHQGSYGMKGSNVGERVWRPHHPSLPKVRSYFEVTRGPLQFRIWKPQKLWDFCFRRKRESWGKIFHFSFRCLKYVNLIVI